MAQDAMLLSLGATQVEVVLPEVGGFEELQRVAQASFGVEPGTYAFYDVCGKLEGNAALQRALHSAAGATQVQVRIQELPEWKKIRELEARIEAVAAQQKHPSSAGANPVSSAVDDAIKLSEAQVLQRVEAAFAMLGDRLQHAEVKIDGALGTFVQTLAFSHIDMKAKLDSIDMAALSSRLDGFQVSLEAARAPVAVATVDTTGHSFGVGAPAWKLDLAPEQDSASPGSRFHIPAATSSPSKLGQGFGIGEANRAPWQEGFKAPAWLQQQLRSSGIDGWGEVPSSGCFTRDLRSRQQLGLDRKQPLSRSTPHLPPVF